MIDSLTIAKPLLVGLLAGLAFFGGLWLTVRNFQKQKNPALIILTSSILRTAFALGIFWWASQDGLVAVGLCIAGFITARFILIKKIENSANGELSPQPGKEGPCT